MTTNTEARQTMTLTIDFPAETERKLLARAAATGKDVATLVREAVEEKLGTPLPSFAEILAPVHEDFRHSAMTEAELNTLLEGTLAEARKERRERQGKAS
jgi:hypothetical protein